MGRTPATVLRIIGFATCFGVFSWNGTLPKPWVSMPKWSNFGWLRGVPPVLRNLHWVTSRLLNSLIYLYLFYPFLSVFSTLYIYICSTPTRGYSWYILIYFDCCVYYLPTYGSCSVSRAVPACVPAARGQIAGQVAGQIAWQTASAGAPNTNTQIYKPTQGFCWINRHIFIRRFPSQSSIPSTNDPWNQALHHSHSNLIPYESNPSVPCEPKIAGKWMFIPPNNGIFRYTSHHIPVLVVESC